MKVGDKLYTRRSRYDRGGEGVVAHVVAKVGRKWVTTDTGRQFDVLTLFQRPTGYASEYGQAYVTREEIEAARAEAAWLSANTQRIRDEVYQSPAPVLRAVDALLKLLRAPVDPKAPRTAVLSVDEAKARALLESVTRVVDARVEPLPARWVNELAPIVAHALSVTEHERDEEIRTLLDQLADTVERLEQQLPIAETMAEEVAAEGVERELAAFRGLLQGRGQK